MEKSRPRSRSAQSRRQEGTAMLCPYKGSKERRFRSGFRFNMEKDGGCSIARKGGATVYSGTKAEGRK